MALNIDDLLRRAVENKASDLHLKVGNHPYMRVDGLLTPITDVPRITPEEMLSMAFSMMTNRQKQKFKETAELDMAYGVAGLGRFRVNVFQQAAETGHLVFSTLHTLDATETIQRIIAVFPPPEQKQIRLQMAATLKAVISQRLVRRADDKGRVPAVEVMIATAYIKDCIINPDKTRLIHDAIGAGTSQYGMQTFDQSLFDLYSKELITLDEALMRASNPDEFKLRIQGIRSAADAAREEMASQMADFERFARK